MSYFSAILEKALVNAMALHIEHDCVRYIIASRGPQVNGAAKAHHHRVICQYLVASLTDKVDPDRVDMRHPLYKEIHDGSQEFTSHLTEKSDERELAVKFARLAVKKFRELPEERDND